MRFEVIIRDKEEKKAYVSNSPYQTLRHYVILKDSLPVGFGGTLEVIRDGNKIV